MWIMNVSWCVAILLAVVNSQNAPEVSLPDMVGPKGVVNPQLRFEDCSQTDYIMTNLKVAGCTKTPCVLTQKQHFIIEAEFEMNGKSVRLQKSDLLDLKVTWMVNMVDTPADVSILKMENAVETDGKSNKLQMDLFVSTLIPAGAGEIRWQASMLKGKAALCFQFDVIILKGAPDKTGQ